MKINFLGDSITEGYGVNKGECYVDVIASKYGHEVRNYGISGTRFGCSTIKDLDLNDLYFALRVEKMNHDADKVVVFGGTNDYGVGQFIPLGNIGDKECNTFVGACDVLIKNLLKHYNKEQIIFIVPIPRHEEFLHLVDPNEKYITPTLHEYRFFVRKITQNYDIKCIDIGNLFPDVFDKEMLPDGIHPSKKAHVLIADAIIEYLK
jgi:lysophospholipase L1-like esterase